MQNVTYSPWTLSQQQDKKNTMDDIKLIFGKRLRKLRKTKGISQETLAFDAGLDRTYISSIERGKRNVSIENIARLAKALEVEIHELFTDK